jgi:hypothetical protein
VRALDGFVTARSPARQIVCVGVSSRYASFCSWFEISQQTQEERWAKARPGTRHSAKSRVRHYAAIAAAAVTGAGLAVGATAGSASDEGRQCVKSARRRAGEGRARTTLR